MPAWYMDTWVNAPTPVTSPSAHTRGRTQQPTVDPDDVDPRSSQQAREVLAPGPISTTTTSTVSVIEACQTIARPLPYHDADRIACDPRVRPVM